MQDYTHDVQKVTSLLKRFSKELEIASKDKLSTNDICGVVTAHFRVGGNNYFHVNKSYNIFKDNTI
mgnify:CR=1 FL=1